MSCCCSFSSFHPPPPPLLLRRRLSPSLSTPQALTLAATAPLPTVRLTNHNTLAVAASSLSPSLSDPFVLDIASKLEDSLSPLSPSLPTIVQSLRDRSAESLLASPWPTRKSDSFRFTDISYLRKHPIIIPSLSPTDPIPSYLNSPISKTCMALINGVLSPSLSQIPSPLPAGVFIGSISNMPAGPTSDKILEILASCGEFQDKDLFWDFNIIGAPDVAVVYVPAGVRMEEPVHFMFGYGGLDGQEEGMAMVNPRVLVVAEEGAEVAVVEEHFGVGPGCYWANPVMDIVIEERAKVSHFYVQRQPMDAAHIKWTVTQQKANSRYEHVEVSTGGRLSRHNLHIQQLGMETETELSAFQLVSQSKQIQDLHSRLVLDHPMGYSRQLHKCIVCNSEGHGVFDGNIKVNRYAQNTDAGQQTRSLLLAPQAMVNVKPNLQIIADDVKCAHGAAISDLNENELFYFQARGLDLQTARNALTYYFGADVIKRIPFKPIQEMAASEIKILLESSRN